MKILTSDCFEIMRIITKMGIKKDLINFIKALFKVNNNVEKIQTILIKIANEKFDGDIEKAVSENIELAEKHEKAIEEQSGLAMEGVFLIVEHMPHAETDIKKIIARLNGVTLKEVEKYEADELINKIMEIVKSESLMRFFSSMTK